jgi:hypothetical protein
VRQASKILPTTLLGGIAKFMKKFAFTIMFTLATMCFISQSFAQGVISAPLLLFTNGAGSISPFQGGQLLVVGQNYEMEGVPDSGFGFSSWQPVDVFTTFEVFESVSESSIY